MYSKTETLSNVWVHLIIFVRVHLIANIFNSLPNINSKIYINNIFNKKIPLEKLYLFK